MLAYGRTTLVKKWVFEMRKLRWMCGYTIRGEIHNNHIPERVRASSSIAEKITESHLRWFEHVQRKPIDADEDSGPNNFEPN